MSGVASGIGETIYIVGHSPRFGAGTDPRHPSRSRDDNAQVQAQIQAQVQGGISPSGGSWLTGRRSIATFTGNIVYSGSGIKAVCRSTSDKHHCRRGTNPRCPAAAADPD